MAKRLLSLFTVIVKKQLDVENQKDFISTLKDINNYGMEGGFNGFIYYKDTVEFYDRNRPLIIKLLEDMSDQFGEDIIDVISNFKVIKDDGYTKSDIAKVLYSKEKDTDVNMSIKNYIVWAMVEYLASELVR